MILRVLCNWIAWVVCSSAVVLAISCHVNVSVVSPISPPTIFYNPVIGCVSYNQNSVVQSSCIIPTASFVIDTPLIMMKAWSVHCYWYRAIYCYSPSKCIFGSKGLYISKCLDLGSNSIWVISTLLIVVIASIGIRSFCIDPSSSYYRSTR